MQRLVVVFLSIMSLPACAVARTPAVTGIASLDRFVTRLNGVTGNSPGLAVVVANSDGPLLIHVDGVLSAATGAPVSTDSPFYIASMTKAYVGLLAARLHAEGILDLDSKVTDHWPQLRERSEVDFSRIALRDLLTHQAPFSADLIAILEAYVASVPPARYPEYLSRFAEPRDPGFDYGNIGYNVYTAILEETTGRSWHEWLRDKVLDPFELRHTTSRTSDFNRNELAWRHQWNGDGWHVLPPKPDLLMQSAGGMFASPADMARWLSVNLRERGAGAFVPTHTAYAILDKNYGEMSCHGYTLGWYECEFGGARVLQHGGGYIGMRTRMALMPDKDVGIAILTNSDNMTGYLAMQIIELFFSDVIGEPWPESRKQETLKAYEERIALLLNGRLRDVEKRRAEPRWSGWEWRPSGEELSHYAGTYTNDLLGTLVIQASRDNLKWRLEGWTMDLLPAMKDRFGGVMAPYEDFEQVDFERNAAGEISGIRWDDFLFRRIELLRNAGRDDNL